MTSHMRWIRSPRASARSGFAADSDSTKPAMPHINQVQGSRFWFWFSSRYAFAAVDDEARVGNRSGDSDVRAEIEMQIGNDIGKGELQSVPPGAADHRAVDEGETRHLPLAGRAQKQHARVGFEFGDP